MNSFDEFWEKHGSAYIEHAKSIANEDFKRLNSVKNGKFIIKIDIETDDDFCLKGGTSFFIYANSKKDAFKKTIIHLRDIQFDNIPEWAKKSDGSLEERYTSKWTHIKDEAMKLLVNGETYISLGGNQTIEIEIRENKPSLSIKLK